LAGADATERARPESLLSGILLERSRVWVGQRPEVFPPAVLSYVRTSIDCAEEQAKRQRLLEARSRRLQRRLLVGALASATVFAAAAVAVSLLWTAAEQAKRQALASLKVAQSAADLDRGNIGKAVLAAMAALDTADTTETRSAALTALLELSPNLARVVPVTDAAPRSLSWDKQGRITVLTDTALIVIDADNPFRPTLEHALRASGEPLPDSVTNHGSAALWPLPTGATAKPSEKTAKSSA
jgi:hypothetical protein